jgi:hypothetical protein
MTTYYRGKELFKNTKLSNKIVMLEKHIEQQQEIIGGY